LLPGAVVAADFNGDHKIDIAVASMGGFPNDQVVIYLNNGDGTFQPPKSFAVGTAVFAMIAGDFNGDGKIDLITGQTESKDLSVLLGNGDGTFQKAVSYPAGGAVGGIVAADFNGDGKLDLAVSNQSPGSLSILLGHGDGTFGAASTQSLGMALVGITAADFNGDGKLDLAIADNNSTVWLLLGAGDGTFGTPQSIALTGTLVGIASGDFNRDKHADLAVANLNAASVYVLLGKGDGTFQPATSLAAGRGAFAVTLGDFNSDGKLDIAVANNFEVPLQNDVSLLLGNGDGTFAAAIPLGAGNNAVGVVAADFTGNGKLDLAVANNGSPFASLLINGFPKGLSSFTSVSAADGSPGLAPESLVSAHAPGISGFGGSAGLPVPTTLAFIVRFACTQSNQFSDPSRHACGRGHAHHPERNSASDGGIRHHHRRSSVSFQRGFQRDGTCGSHRRQRERFECADSSGRIPMRTGLLNSAHRSKRECAGGSFFFRHGNSRRRRCVQRQLHHPWS
jgi:hypothetical protein